LLEDAGRRLSAQLAGAEGHPDGDPPLVAVLWDGPSGRPSYNAPGASEKCAADAEVKRNEAGVRGGVEASC